jgi:hypothetical protein
MSRIEGIKIIGVCCYIIEQIMPDLYHIILCKAGVDFVELLYARLRKVIGKKLLKN